MDYFIMPGNVSSNLPYFIKATTDISMPRPTSKSSWMEHGNRVRKFNSVNHYKAEGDLWDLPEASYNDLISACKIKLTWGTRSALFSILSGPVYANYNSYYKDYASLYVPVEEYELLCGRMVTGLISYNNQTGRPLDKFLYYYETKKNVLHKYYYYYTVGGWSVVEYSSVTIAPNVRPYYGVISYALEAFRCTKLDEMKRVAQSLTLPEDWESIQELCVSGLEGIHATSLNGFAFLADINVIKQGIDVILALKNPPKTLKELADFYLSEKFGLSATVRDYAQLYDDTTLFLDRVTKLAEHADYKARARDRVLIERDDLFIHQARSFTAYLNNYPDKVMEVLNTIADWGLYPTAKNGWDLIPFSFVCDWFTNVSDRLRAWDYNNARLRYDCIVSMQSVKSDAVFKPQAEPGRLSIGQIYVTAYERRVSTQLPEGRFNTEYSVPGFRKWITGSALIVQRCGK